MNRENQTFIGLRLDPELLAAVDKKRVQKRQSRSEFVREAIFEFIKDTGISRDLVYPQDRVGKAKGGRPKKINEMSGQEAQTAKKLVLERLEAATRELENVHGRLSSPEAQDVVFNIPNRLERFETLDKIEMIKDSLIEGKATLAKSKSHDRAQPKKALKRRE